ncbi:MAG: hypothetical protein ACRDAW_01650 [Metamycoplasmataceae bacterium]
MEKDVLLLNDQIITDEFYYDSFDLSKGEGLHPDWLAGLKKVFDAKDEKCNDFQNIITTLTDDQIRMLTLLDTVMDENAPNNNLVAIFTNFSFNENGEKNLIEQVAVIYQFTENIYMVARFANYTLTNFAKNYDLSKLDFDE